MERAHHVASLSANLYKLQQETKLCDTELQCSDGVVLAHSAVLSSSSSILNNMITGTNMKLPLNSYNKQTVRELVEYLYTGDVNCDNIEDPVLLYRLTKFAGITVESLQLRLLESQDGKMLLELDEVESSKNTDSFGNFTPGPAVALSEKLLENLMKYGCAPIGTPLEVKEEREKQENCNVSDDAEDNTDEDFGNSDETIEKTPLKAAVPRIKELVKMAKNLKEHEQTKSLRKTRRQIKSKRLGRRKGRKPRSIKQGQLGTYREVESKVESETVEEKRAKWREVYYKKKALGTLKYQKFLSPKLPPDRKCPECGIILRTYRSLVQHKNIAHGIPFSEEDIERLQMRCAYPECDFITARPVKMQYHRDTHEAENQGDSSVDYPCSFCDKRYKSKKELRNHSKCHTAAIKNCEICDKPLKGYYYSVHMNTVHNKDHVWQCHLCDYRVRGRELWFKYHLITKHNDTSRGTVEIFRCQYCDYTAPKKQNVARHTRVRHEIALGLRPKEAICDICGKEFGEKGLMVAHRARHTDPERFKCSFCTYKSPDYRSFETHVRTQHTQKDVRPWRCDLCSHAAKEKGNLKKHFRSKHKMSEEDAAARMKTIKPETTAPIYVPLSEYKDPENNVTLPPPPRHRVTPKLKSFESEEMITQESEDFEEQTALFQKTTNVAMDQTEFRVAEPVARVVGSNIQGVNDSSAQAISSSVAAVLQAAESSQEPSLHTLAAAAMMPQSMHPAMSMYVGLSQMHSNGLPTQVSNSNTLPTASCFFGPQPTLPQPSSQANLQLQNQSQQHQQPPPQPQQPPIPHQGQQQQHNQQGFGMPVKYENVHHVQPYLEKYDSNNQTQHSFSQV